MKRLILIAALALSATAQAEDYCMELSGGARAVMYVRQTGLSAQTQHQIVDQTTFGQDAQILHIIINDAYTYPLATGKEQKEKVIQSFDVHWLLKCMKARNGFY